MLGTVSALLVRRAGFPSLRPVTGPILLVSLLGVTIAPAMEVHPATEQDSVLAPLAENSLLLEGAVASGRLVAVGERGHVLLSDDGGRGWRQVRTPTRATLTAVTFHGGSDGWAAGHDQVILRTENGGERWAQVYADPADERPVFDLWFRDADHGVAVGAYGLFLETSDGGDTWASRWISEDDFHLYRLVPAGEARLFIAAEAGMVYRSEDAGQTWVALDSPYEGSFFGALWLGGDSLLLYGLRGHLFRTEDGGDSWQALDSGTEASLTDGVMLGGGRVVLVGLGGTVLVSDDGGRSFFSASRGDRKGIAAVVPTVEGELVILGEAGVGRIDDVQ